MSAEVRTVVLRSSPLFLNLVTEWNSGDRSQTILWSPTSDADVVYHRVTLKTPVPFTEIINQAEWGTLYYAMKAVRDDYQFTFTRLSHCLRRGEISRTKSRRILTLGAILRTMEC